MQIYKQLLYLLSPKERRTGFWLILMYLVMALLDIVGVASIMPFIYVLSNPEVIETNNLINTAFNISNKIGIETAQEFIFALGISFFILLVLSLSFKALTTFVQTHFTQMRQYSIAKKLTEGYLHQPYSWFLNRHSADLGKTILSEVGIIVSSALKPSLNLIAQIIVTLSLITLIVFTNPKLALIVGLILILAFSVIYKISRSFLQRIGEERVKSNHLRFTALSEAFGAVKEIKLGGFEQIYIDKFSNAAKRTAAVSASGKIVSDLPRYAVEAVAFGGLIIVVLYLMKNSGNFSEIIPIVALYSLAGYRLLPALQQIYSEVTELRFVVPALNIMYNDLKSLQPINDNENKNLLSFNDQITLSSISYSYPNASKKALKNINLNIPIRSTVGFVGATGSGKTTAVDIILGLLQAQQGTLKIDGKIIDKTNQRSWQKLIGYVPQQIYISDDTIAANIAFGEKNPKKINMEDVESAAKNANLHDFIVSDLPQKYQTTVGERGIRLSGGQRQRIGIARALYYKPKVLILDEATSALDNLTEKAVMEGIHKLSKDEITIIIIAHRLSTVKECDTIFLFDKGELKSQGSFEELIKISAKFRATVDQM